MLLWNFVGCAVMAFEQPFGFVPAHLEFHVHEILLLFSRIQLIFRISSDQVETSIPFLPESVTSFRFVAIALRSVDCYQANTSSLTYVRGGTSYPSGYSLPLLCSASFLALALVHVLSVAFLRPVSSILVSFAGDASPSVLLRFYHAIFSKVLQKTLALPQS